MKLPGERGRQCAPDTPGPAARACATCGPPGEHQGRPGRAACLAWVWLGGAGQLACPATPPAGPSRCCGQPPLNGETSGLVLEYRPAGFGYQTQTCIVNRSGWKKKKNDAPEPGAVAGQSCWVGSGTNVPSL